jgi:hypothetical protein
VADWCWPRDAPDGGARKREREETPAGRPAKRRRRRTTVQEKGMRDTARDTLPVPACCRPSVSRAVSRMRFLHGETSPRLASVAVKYTPASREVELRLGGYTTITDADVACLLVTVREDAYMERPRVWLTPRDPRYKLTLTFRLLPDAKE